jgi:cell division protein FtsW
MVKTTRTPAPLDVEEAKKRAVIGVKTLFETRSPEYIVMVSMVIFLVIFGLTMVLSSSFVTSSRQGSGDPFAVAMRQVVWATVGVPLMLVIGRMAPSTWRPLAPTLLLAGMALQSLVIFTPLGVAAGGNRNWLTLGGLTGQPSEFLKLALIIWMAAVLSRYLDVLADWRRWLGRMGMGLGLSMGLVMMGQDLGTVGIMVLIILGLFFVAGVRLSHLALVLGVLVALGALASVIAPYRMARFAVWLSGCGMDDYLSQCWQPLHSLWAMGSGGVFGVGLGNSRAKWFWLPEAETDYIFAIIGEELGIIGTSVVVITFVVLAVSMVRLIRANPDPFAKLVTAGVMMWIIGQALVNIAVVLELLPVLGVPLPFVSSGGSALMAGLMAFGVVMSVNRGGATTSIPPAPAPPANRRRVSAR